MGDPLEQLSPPSGPRLVGYYVVLAASVAAVVWILLAAGSGKHAQQAIAGGYDVSAGTACLGSSVELGQSGQFVSIGDAGGNLSGNLTFKRNRLTGTVSCVDRLRAPMLATFSQGFLGGSIGGRRMLAVLRRDPPPPGVPKPRAPGSITGSYQLAPSSACVGTGFTVAGSGRRLWLSTHGVRRGVISYERERLSGAVACSHGANRRLTGTAVGRQLDIVLAPLPGARVSSPVEHVSATLQRPADQTVEAFLLAAAMVVLFARLCGSVMARLGQPRVMGEVLAGIALGPTVFGVLDPGLQVKLFAPDIVPYIGVTATLGLVFYMFLIGLEVDLAQVRGHVRTTLVVSNTGLAVPMILGMASALALYTLLAPSKRFVAFALFMGVSMSVTAFPVLARIMSERRMLKRPLGTVALSAAAIDDVSAWFLVALAMAVAGAGTTLGVLSTIAWTLLFCLVMAFLVRPVLRRAGIAYDEAGRLPGTWTTVIFAGVLLAAVTTQQIGVAVIFGAFVMGLAMPRHARLSREVTQRVEDFVLTLLLPLYFAYTGLRTDLGLLDRPALILVMLGLIAIAIGGKYGGTLIAARAMRFPWRESAALGALMNTRGLTELIVLNLALDAGVISPALFSMLVVMALVTTLMTGPILRLIDPAGNFGAAPERELAAATRLTAEEAAPPASSILVAPQSDATLESLLVLAAPLARSEPERELILARLVRPPFASAVRGGLQTEAELVRAAANQLEGARRRLLDQGISTRAVAMSSADPGRDVTRLSASHDVDLVLVDGQRPLLGHGVPRGDVGLVLNEARCDVAVLVAREGQLDALSPESRAVVPFGGAEHDWAALELAAWLCAATGASLELMGAAGHAEDGKDAGHLLASAALLVQQFTGVAASAAIAEPGRQGVLSAAAGARLLVVGLSDRWRREGLGETRRAIARAAPAPIVFVRRGERPGALAPASDATRFAWSSPRLRGGHSLS